MKIINLKHPEKEMSLFRGCGLCLGHFDGLHIGHRALIEELKRISGGFRPPLPLGALCFSKPPAFYLSRNPAPQLTTLKEKLMLLRQAGLSFVILYDFPEIMSYSPEEFVKHILIKDCACQTVTCGFNYTFGAGGAGTPTMLADLFEKKIGRKISVVGPVLHAGRPVSSTGIRKLLEQGRVKEATLLLGRPYFITGTVQSGRHVGHTIDAPTANLLFPPEKLIPKHGVYASRVKIGRKTYNALTNIGVRPTFDDGDTVTCETFVLNYHGDLYGRPLQVDLLGYIRPEKRFSDPSLLEYQIKDDIESADAFF